MNACLNTCLVLGLFLCLRFYDLVFPLPVFILIQNLTSKPLVQVLMMNKRISTDRTCRQQTSDTTMLSFLTKDY